MITQLEIKNFKGFSEYKIDDIGQVNLLVGTNNCGKTSVLEAIYLLKSRDTSVLYSFIPEKDEFIQNEERMHRDVEGDLCQLFHGFNLTPKLDLAIVAADQSIEGLSFFINETEKVKSSFLKFTPYSAGQYQLDVEWLWDQNRYCRGKCPISREGGLIYNYMRKSFDSKSKMVACDINIKLVPSLSLNKEEIIFLLDKILLTSDEDLMLEAVRIVEQDIVRVASVGKGGIIVKSRKWEKRIPVDSFGDGIRRLLGIVLSLIGAKNGTLLIDEIDTGLHHTVMSKMWKLVCATAKKLNVQVFATTHSRDCWETLADNAIEDEFADMSIRIHRIDKDMKQAETFTNKEINLAFNRELEVR
ncbi:AAA family ATPase [Candidatus Electronema sp. JM]|uniref:AAA family ATPase n=1 Tax=Candidatus Electronema sp. JM TaxID=3401571 RepID=UPI003AA8745C